MGYTNVALLNKYLFNGKEKQDQTGMYDYGFRQYDAVTGRWVCADKMAEMYVSSSPYAYVRNNPVNRVDVMGLWDDQDWGGPGDEEDPYMLAEVVCTPENWFDKFANSVADLFSKYSDEDYIEEPNEQYNSGTWEYMFWGDSNASENNLFEYSPQELHDNGYFVTSTAIQVVLLTLPVTEIFQGTVGLLRSAKAVETGVNEVNVANTGGKAVEDFVSVFHKGVLNEGVVSSSRSLSTGLEKASVEALERYGAVWEFKIPKTEFLQWKYNGLIESIMDLDKATGIINQEIRFSSSLAPKLNQYIVIP
jgi:RHS repeat-associated protein